MTGLQIYKTHEIKNLKDMLEQCEANYGDKDAFLVRDENNTYKSISYRHFKNDVDALGTAFLDIGLKGSRIAILSENRYEWCVSYMSAVNGTGVVVPLDKELPLPEIENLLIRSGASAIVFSGKFEKEMKVLSATLGSVQYFINMDIPFDKPGQLSFSSLLENGRNLISSGNRSFLDASIDENCMSILLFTSGTTDLAKGVMLSHRNICSDIKGVCSVLYIDRRDTVLSILPLHHTYECTGGFLLMMYRGCTLVFNDHLKNTAKNLREVKPSVLVLVPLILEGMYKRIWDQASKKLSVKIKLKAAMLVSNFLSNILGIDLKRRIFAQIHESIGGRVRLVISGAAAIDPEISKGFAAFGINVLQGYGLTECSPVVTVNREKDFRHNSIGQPLPGVEVIIHSPSPDGIGEIAVTGDNVMLGYYENELATEKIIKNGWLYTGDLGCMDKNGFVYITGRKKNVIVTKNGKNIFPEEVESYLNKSPYILETLVSGSFDDVSGETLVTAQIVPDMEAVKQKLKVDNISSDELNMLISMEVKAVNKHMPLYKRVRHFTVRQDEFSKTTTKKIKRYDQKTG